MPRPTIIAWYNNKKRRLMKKTISTVIYAIISLSLIACSGGGGGNTEQPNNNNTSLPSFSFDSAFLSSTVAGLTSLNPIVGINADRDYTFTATGPVQAGSESGDQSDTITLEVPGLYANRSELVVTMTDEFGNAVTLNRDIFMQEANPTLAQSTIDNYHSQSTSDLVANIEINANVPYQSIQLIDTDNGNAVRASTSAAGAAGVVSIDLDLSVNNVFNGFIRMTDHFGNVVDGPILNTYRFAFTQVSSGNMHTCAIDLNGRAYCWGNGSNGRLGNNVSTGTFSTPVAVHDGAGLGLTGVQSISAGGGHTCAINAAGAAFCWGMGAQGRLGNNDDIQNMLVPVAVETSTGLGATGVQSISAGSLHTCAINAAGAAFCWGYGLNGRLGNNSTIDALVPTTVETSTGLGATGVQSISAGDHHTCAINAAGAAFCWGDGGQGRLGNNDTQSALTPVAVHDGAGLGLTGVQSISAGSSNTCAINAAGAAYCWGNGSSGKLGNNSTGSSSSPVAVETSTGLGATGVQSISTGSVNSCAINAAGAAYCWGSGSNGALGNNSVGMSMWPNAVETSTGLGATGVQSISAGAAHSCAVNAAGAAYCWGSGLNGRLGNGDTVNALEPEVVDISEF